MMPTSSRQPPTQAFHRWVSVASGYREQDTGQGLVLMGLARDTSGWQRREVGFHPHSRQVASWVGMGPGLPGGGGVRLPHPGP